ncbi:MAG: hypothetical protein ABRQ34_09170, partial [Smithellaceae bacterium]
IARQMIVFHKTMFDNNFQTMKSFYEQTERVLNKLCENSPVISEEGKKAVANWMKTFGKGYTDFKRLADENFRKVENYFEGKNAPKS